MLTVELFPFELDDFFLNFENPNAPRRTHMLVSNVTTPFVELTNSLNTLSFAFGGVPAESIPWPTVIIFPSPFTILTSADCIVSVVDCIKLIWL